MSARKLPPTGLTLSAQEEQLVHSFRAMDEEARLDIHRFAASTAKAHACRKLPSLRLITGGKK